MKGKILLLACLISTNLIAQNLGEKTDTQIIDLHKYFEPFNGSFILLDLKTDKTKVYNDSVASVRYSPCSTFKITNSLIGIESKVALNEDYKIKYDSLRNPPQSWWNTKEPFKYWKRDHTLKSAIKYSVVWYYQELARRIGEEDMKRLLKRIDYGNNDISSGIDNFWLCGSIKISAKEQIDFLKKLYNKQLVGFSNQSQEIVKDIMLYESTENYKLYGKTGGGDCWDDTVIGWYVGFVETESNTYIFALNMFVKSFNDLGNKRTDITKKILLDLKIIEQ
ncbi:MAG: class D beta-lactamase [bacterium]|nr:class D beta-lactamase [bacterium]